MAMDEQGTATFQEDADILCPYCGSECEAEWVDLGVDLVQAGPYHCPACRAVQIEAFAEEETYTRRERATGWYEPPVADAPCAVPREQQRVEQRHEAARHRFKKRRGRWFNVFRLEWLALSLGAVCRLKF